MILVDYQLAEESLAEDLQHTPSAANVAALEETYFVMPVRLCIEGVELLELSQPTKQSILIIDSQQRVQVTEGDNEANIWMPLPLLGFATHSLEALRRTTPDSPQVINLAGYGQLTLTAKADRLSIESNINGRAATTDLADAIEAFKDFSNKVRLLLSSLAPAIQHHPNWNRWFA